MVGLAKDNGGSMPVYRFGDDRDVTLAVPTDPAIEPHEHKRRGRMRAQASNRKPRRNHRRSDSNRALDSLLETRGASSAKPRRCNPRLPNPGPPQSRRYKGSRANGGAAVIAQLGAAAEEEEEP